MVNIGTLCNHIRRKEAVNVKREENIWKFGYTLFEITFAQFPSRMINLLDNSICEEHLK